MAARDELEVGHAHTYLQFALQALDVLNCEVQHVGSARLLSQHMDKNINHFIS